MVSEPTVKVGGLEFVTFIDQEAISSRVATLGKQITADFEDKKPLFIPILNGAFMFAADLLKEVNLPCEVSFVKVSSYAGASTSGDVKEVLGLQTSIEGRHVILVEDIVDTGLTMQKIVESFTAMRPASLTIATLFLKPEALKVTLPIGYTGFSIENKFIIGYGLDYNGLGRNYRDVYQKAD